MKKLALQPVLLCGGSGTRLWPLSRTTHPKQFADFGLGHSLFRETAERAASICRLPLITVCGEAHRFHVENELHGLPFDPVLVEPFARDTAAAMALTCVAYEAQDPLMVMMPCDHYLPDLDTLRASFVEAATLAEQGKLVLLGIQPTHPATGYGYIERDIGSAVLQMREKPDTETASQLISSGCLWNSGMLVFRVSTLIRELTQHSPEVLTSARAAYLARTVLDRSIRADAAAYAQSPKISLDYAVLEKSRNLACVAYGGRWSDLGTWVAMAQMHALDAQANVAIGDSLLDDCQNVLAVSSSRLVCVQGLSDAVVVETPDAVYVAHRNRAENVKKIVAELESHRRKEAAEPYRVHRPWGWYESLARGATYQSKRLMVRAGAAISLQYHHHRSEHWVVVRGTATVTKDNETLRLCPGESVYIPAGCVHRLAAPDEDVEVIEVQTGTYFGEDDIVRLEDKYAR